MSFQNTSLFPSTANINGQDHLELGGCDIKDLAAEFGTPLYIFDETTLREQCREFTSSFRKYYPNTSVLYASKAFINLSLAQIFLEEGLGLDVVSGGELAVAQAINFPPEKIYFHGNNKGQDELELALDYGIGRVVVDNFHELDLLSQISSRMGITQDILIRISPGVDPHTHAYTTTGIIDSKFGFPIQTGQAEEAIQKAVQDTNFRVMGLHFHLGSPIFELDPYVKAMEIAIAFASRVGLHLQEISPGGGFAIGYTIDQPPPQIDDYAKAITSALRGSDNPLLSIEPGRSISGRAGVALYSVGASKEIPGIRKYVSVDGGMGDNIRPALYGSQYEAVVANRMGAHNDDLVSIAGKFCESGDVLLRDIMFPKLQPGDLIAVPASGAYAPAMASNYNLATKPAIVLVKDGKARLIRKRETYADLIRNDLL